MGWIIEVGPVGPQMVERIAVTGVIVERIAVTGGPVAAASAERGSPPERGSRPDDEPGARRAPDPRPEPCHHNDVKPLILRAPTQSVESQTSPQSNPNPTSLQSKKPRRLPPRQPGSLHRALPKRTKKVQLPICEKNF
jgi:hypothetical protein